MTKRIVTICPYCGKPHTIGQNSVESAVKFSPETSQNVRSLGFWAQDGPNYAFSGFVAFLGLWLVCWLYLLPFWLAVAGGLLVGLGLHVLKVILYRPSVPKGDDKPKRVKVTMTIPLPDGNMIQLDETFGVPAQAIEYVARRVAVDGMAFSRRKCCKRGLCSQPQFEIIQGRMLARHWAACDPTHPQGGVVLNRHGLAVLRAIARG